MKIRDYLLAAGVCLLLTGCAGKGQESTAESESVPELTSGTEALQTDAAAVSTAPVTTVTETTTAVTTTEPPKAYEWVKEPFLEADDINVVPAEGASCNYGDFLEADYALILRGELLGMVDYDGNVVMEPKYKAVRGMLDSAHAHYDFQSEPSPAGTSQVFCVKSQKFVVYESTECPACGAAFSTCYSATGYAYEKEQGFAGTYAADLLHTSAQGDALWLHGQIGFERNDNLTDTVAARCITLPQDYLTDTSAKGAVAGGFGLIRGNQILVPFDYQGALDFKSGVAALCKEGKWGYFNAEGTEILPFDYDADMIYAYDPKRYIPDFGEDGADVYVPYLPSEGFIALNCGDQAGYSDTEGREIVPVSEFACTRPVHGGRAWVQDAKSGLWGIISLD